MPDPGAEEIDGVSLLPLLHSPSAATPSWKRTFSLQEGWWVPWKLQPNGTAPVYTGLRTINPEMVRDETRVFVARTPEP